MVRSEYKLWIYATYFLPPKRFLLTVHTVTKSHLTILDTLTDKAIKRWAGVPPSATHVMIHMKEGLDIKSIYQLYTEAYTISHVRTRTQGDSIVSNAINCTLKREVGWSTKKSTAVESEASYLHALNECAPGGEAPVFTGDQASKLQHQFNVSVKNQTKKTPLVTHTKESHDKVKSLVVQGTILPWLHLRRGT